MATYARCENPLCSHWTDLRGGQDKEGALRLLLLLLLLLLGHPQGGTNPKEKAP